jgi:hypothetical protein
VAFATKTYPSQPIKGEGVLMVDLIISFQTISGIIPYFLSREKPFLGVFALENWTILLPIPVIF